jgi:sigma-B regulation protein RsbU (phosphoserine phosphatase)
MLTLPLGRSGTPSPYSKILLTQSNHISEIAQSWLYSGATAFGVWSQDTPLAHWPIRASLEEPTLFAPIFFHDKQVGEFRVVGPSNPANKARLNAEARMISHLLQMEEGLRELSARVSEMQKNLANTELKSELELVSKTQARLLPQKYPNVPRLDLAANLNPSARVGGDFYDFISAPNRPFIFTVGEVSGSGANAALVMSMLRTLTHSAARFMPNPLPRSILNRVNEDLYEDFAEYKENAAMLIGLYDPFRRQLVYSGAGHSPAIYCQVGRPALLLESSIPALGLASEIRCDNIALNMNPGDVVVITTAGVSHSTNREGQIFGNKRLLSLTQQVAELSAAEISTAIFEHLREFSEGQAQKGDQTVLVLKATAL